MNEQATARAIVISALLQHSRYKGDYRNFIDLDSKIYEEAEQLMRWVNRVEPVLFESPQEPLA